MSLLDRLERRFRPYALPELTMYLVFGQGLFTLLGLLRPEFLGAVELQAGLVAQGEWWRLITFLFYPPTTNPIFAFFALYLLLIMGTALEREWGTFRYNVYVLIAYLMTIAVVWIRPDEVATNIYITTSIFLAFAWLFPTFEILLFFILPVQVKWLALIAWAFLGIRFIAGDVMTKVLVLASIANFLLFFGREIVQRAKGGHRKMLRQGEKIKERSAVFHSCAVCGITDKSHPRAEFRYCSECVPTTGYCVDHIKAHEHRRAG